VNEPTPEPKWVQDFGALQREYTGNYLQAGAIERIVADFQGALASGRITLPLPMFVKCSFGHHMVLGNLVQSQASAKIFFVPDLSFIGQPTNGVFVWQNGDPTALGKAGVFWATLRIRLTCPQKGCTYSPQLQSSALAAHLMLAALDGDLTPVLDV